ncbi:MAG: type II toxin-antitoxin system VapC family toxin [Chloroflexota bacterium]|nr:type II toxin-antitoxin system VapC family toxin [Chloroflexota bacterium]
MAVKWHLPDEEDADRALGLLAPFEQGTIDFVAPYHIRYEVGSALSVATIGRSPRVPRDQGETAMAEFLALPIKTYADEPLLPAAFALVHLHGCAFYDALYLALAQRLKIPFVTADRKLLRRIDHLPSILPLSDFPASAA